MALSNVTITNRAGAKFTDLSTFDASTGVTHIEIRTNSSSVGFIKRWDTTREELQYTAKYTDTDGNAQVVELSFSNGDSSYNKAYGRYVTADLPKTTISTAITVVVYSAGFVGSSGLARQSSEKWNTATGITWDGITAGVLENYGELSGVSIYTRSNSDTFKSVTLYTETSDGVWTGTPLTVSGDKHTATLEGSVNACFWGRYYFEIEWGGAKTINVTNSIEGATETHTYDGDTDTLTLTITAKDGYQFKDCTAEYTDAAGSAQTQTFTGTTATLTLSVLADSVVTLQGSTEKTKTINVTNNIEGTTETHTYDGDTDTLTLTITAKDGYQFKDCTAEYTDATGSAQTQTFTGTTATLTLSVLADSVVTLQGSTIKTLHVTFDVDNLEYHGTDSVGKGNTYICRLDALSGFIFKSDDTPYVEYKDTWGALNQAYFTISEDTLSATITFDTSQTNADFKVIGVAYIEHEIANDYGAVNVYKVTNENLADFAKQRFFKETIDTKTTYVGLYESVDLAQFVNSIKRIYIDVTATQSTTIQCGNYTTDIKAQQPTSATYEYDFGVVSVPTPNNSAVDYQCEIQLFLPFVGFQSVPSDYAGRDIQLTAHMDVVTGTGTYKLLCDGILFAVIDFEPCRNVIYRTWANTTIGEMDYSAKVQYGLTPYVVVKSYTESKDIQSAEHKRVTLSECSGYVQVEQVDGLTSDNMLQNEYADITALLAQGVTFL